MTFFNVFWNYTVDLLLCSGTEEASAQVIARLSLLGVFFSLLLGGSDICLRVNCQLIPSALLKLCKEALTITYCSKYRLLFFTEGNYLRWAIKLSRVINLWS